MLNSGAGAGERAATALRAATPSSAPLAMATGCLRGWFLNFIRGVLAAKHQGACLLETGALALFVWDPAVKCHVFVI